MTKHAIVEQIYLVFRDTTYPGDSNIVFNPYDPESQEILEYFVGRTWQEVNRSLLHRDSTATYFLSPEGVRYYLPTLMIAMLEENTLLTDCILRIMSYSDNRFGHESDFLNIFMPLTLDEKYCVRDFLRYIQSSAQEEDRENAEKALSSFWETLPISKMQERWEYCLYVEKQFKQYYANLHIDREFCFQELEKSVFENASDEQIVRLMEYFLRNSELLGGSVAFGNRGKEEPRLREETLFLYCLRRLEDSSDGQKALHVLQSMKRELRLKPNADYGKYLSVTLKEMRKRYVPSSCWWKWPFG